VLWVELSFLACRQYSNVTLRDFHGPIVHTFLPASSEPHLAANVQAANTSRTCTWIEFIDLKTLIEIFGT
jgi:hypothetical protein